VACSLSSTLVPLFLTNISPFLDHHFLPAPSAHPRLISPQAEILRKHVQLLLYLTIHPPPHIIAHSPISLLYKLLSLHIPAAFAHCIPTIPTSAKANEHPRWLNWEANGRMEEEARKTLRRCREEGVWGLVSVHEKAGKKKEEEEEEGTERIVGEKGWEVLEWLVAVWEADQAGFEKDNTGRSESLQTKSGLLLLSQRPAACNELI